MKTVIIGASLLLYHTAAQAMSTDYNWNYTVNKCALWVQQEYPRFLAYADSSTHIRMFGTERAMFKFDICMNNEGYATTGVNK